jgi:hypothetical protein
MRSKLAVSVIGVGLVVALAAAFASPSVASARSSARLTRSSSNVNLQISLTGRHAYPRAAGSSQYQAQPGQSEFQTEVEHVRSLAGRQLLVKVNGTTVGKMKVSRQGRADLTLNSELGQSVPAITPGVLVKVTTNTGTLVALSSVERADTRPGGAYVSASTSPLTHGAATSTALLRLRTMSSAPSVGATDQQFALPRH